MITKFSPTLRSQPRTKVCTKPDDEGSLIGHPKGSEMCTKSDEEESLTGHPREKVYIKSDGEESFTAHPRAKECIMPDGDGFLIGHPRVSPIGHSSGKVCIKLKLDDEGSPIRSKVAVTISCDARLD